MLLDGGALGRAAHNPVAWGVALGLLTGKILGVAGTSLVAVRLRLGSLPGDLTMRHVLGLVALAGIGFTVSLFIAELAYPGSKLVDLARSASWPGRWPAAWPAPPCSQPGATHPAGTRRPPQSMEREHRDRPPAA